MGKASAPRGPRVLSLLRAQLTLPWEVRALSCTPFSGQTQGDGPCMWPPSPEPASQHLCHKSGPPVLRPAFTSHQADFTSSLACVVRPAWMPSSPSPSAQSFPFSRLREMPASFVKRSLMTSVHADSCALCCWSALGWMEGVRGFTTQKT